MHPVFEAANTIEAHILLGLLRSEGIDGRSEGEYLTGGIGELPVMGLVRILVPEHQVARARGIIRDWEAGIHDEEE